VLEIAAAEHAGRDGPHVRHLTETRGRTMGAFHAEDHRHDHRPRIGSSCASGIGGPVGSGKTELVACLCEDAGRPSCHWWQ